MIKIKIIVVLSYYISNRMSRVIEQVRNEYGSIQEEGCTLGPEYGSIQEEGCTLGPLASRCVEEYENYLDNYLRQLSGNPDWAKLFSKFEVMDRIERVFRLNKDIFENPKLSEFLSTDHSHDGLEVFLRVLNEFAKANPEKLLLCLTDLVAFIGIIDGAKNWQLYLDPETRSGSLHGQPLFPKVLTVLQQGARQLVLHLVGDVMDDKFQRETNRFQERVRDLQKEYESL